MSRFRPIPDPSGALQPPNRYPPTAVGVGTPEPDPRPAPPRRRAARGSLVTRVARGMVRIPLRAVNIAARAVRRAVRMT
jgi:hypothetical protein